MKRLLPLLLTLALCLTACGGEKKSDKTPEELNAAYTAAITAARDEEMNQYFPVITGGDQTDADMREMVLAALGLDPADAGAYGVSLSLMNVNAYAVVAVMPAEGKGDAVRKGLEGYIDSQKQSFEHYLEDQYQVAADAKLEELSDGTLLLVMCPGQDQVFDSIKASLEG